MDAFPRTFQETWSKLSRGWIGNGLREGAFAEALYPTPDRGGQAHQTKR